MFFTTTSLLSPVFAFALVSFSLGELGDGLNIFQGIYLVGLGWNEGSVGLALSLMGLTALLFQTVAGDIVDKTTVDRRLFLAAASIVIALSALAIMLVREGNTDHLLIFITKIIEGVASSFIGPCLGALTLASFGPRGFDAVMASNVFWGHVGSVVAAILAGVAGHLLYPNVKYSFLVIAVAALTAVVFVQYLPQGDPLMGRGFQGKVALDLHGHLEPIPEADSRLENGEQSDSFSEASPERPPQAASYWEVFSDRMTCILSLTGFFFHFANANVLLLLGELMGSSFPLTAAAIVLAQITMAIATVVGGRLTTRSGVGRKPLLVAGLLTLPIRCALIIYFKESGQALLLSTQILDGLGAGLVTLLHPYIVADITFGTGRFNVVMGLTASFFGLGATMSNFLGQLVVEKLGHVASLTGSLAISIVPLLLFGCFMPETMGQRGRLMPSQKEHEVAHLNAPYAEMT